MLSPKHGEDSSKLRQAALERGWEVLRWQSWQRPLGLDTTGAFLYASALFAERVSELTGLLFTEPPDDWLVSLPDDLVKRSIELTSLAVARDSKRRAFYKPASFKTFKAGVYESGAGLPDETQADGTTPVLVSEVVKWVSEFRFFLLDGKALTGSVYYRDGESAMVDGAWPSSSEEFRDAKDLAERAWSAIPGSLHRSVVIDTGYIEGLGWAVIEANPSWGSGLYGSAPSLALEVISQGCG